MKIAQLSLLNHTFNLGKAFEYLFTPVPSKLLVASEGQTSQCPGPLECLPESYNRNTAGHSFLCGHANVHDSWQNKLSWSLELVHSSVLSTLHTYFIITIKKNIIKGVLKRYKAENYCIFGPEWCSDLGLRILIAFCCGHLQLAGNMRRVSGHSG